MKKNNDTINPYFLGLSLIYHRLLWDFHPYSWISRSRVKALQNRYRNQKAVILCNGPSLNKVNFDELSKHNIYTFGLNKINLLFSNTEFRPSAIIAVNPYVIEQNQKFYNNTRIRLFLDSRAHKNIILRKNVIFLHSKKIKSNFALNCAISVNQGYTVTYVAMQIAYHMGFSYIALVGCDHTFSSVGFANERIKSGSIDPDHFSQKYFYNGQVWQYPDLPGSEFHYRLAKNIFERHKRKIVNCTTEGKLEIFERKSLHKFLDDQEIIGF